MSTQSEKLTAIANAIRAKEGSSDLIPANDFPARIAAIETGIQLPTLTNPGTAADLAQGKQLLDQEGKIVNGGLYEVPYNLVCNNGIPGTGSSGDIPAIYLQGSLENAVPANVDLLVRKDKGVYVYSPATNFGNATAADVAYGKTFTSVAGVKVTGTMARNYLQGFSAQISGNGGNTAWVNYPGQNLPTAIFITAYEGITSGNDLFTLLAFGQYGAYTTANYRAVIDEVSYGSQKSGVLSITQSGSQINITLPKSSDFGYGLNYLVGGFYTQ